MLDYRSQIENLTYMNYGRNLYCTRYCEEISLDKCKVCEYHRGITILGDIYCSFSGE